jgi:outer membrane protein assembly factor BamB
MSDDVQQTPQRGIAWRWAVLAAIWVVGVATLAILWNAYRGDRTMQIMMIYFVAPAIPFWTIVWWLTLAPVSMRARVVTLSVLVGLFGVSAAVGSYYYRFDGFSGDFIPRFSLRSDPTAEQRFLESFKAPDAPAEAKKLAVQPGDWPQFRGTGRDGIAETGSVRRDWKPDETPPELWRKEVGPGWSSFCVVDGHIFTQMQIDQDESVVAYDLESGEELWVHRDKGVRFEELRFGVGPAGTPTFHEGRLYTLGATGQLNCLEAATGRQVWETNILEDAGMVNLEWSMAGSPLVFGNLVVVNPGGEEGKSTGLTAYNIKTGKRVWSDGEQPASYSSPVLAEVDGVPQVLIFDGYGLAGHDPNSGRRLWEFPWSNNPLVNAAMPILRDDGAVFISTGYDTGAALLRVEKDGRKWTAETTDWKTQHRFQMKFGDPVESGGKVYGLNETILTCLDLDTGKLEWRKRGEFGYGQLILADGVLIVLSETGHVSLIDPFAKGQPVLLEFEALKDDEKTWGHPAFVRGKLLVRNAAEMACYDLSPAAK